MWSAAILAGGQARRFGGRDKSALLVHGRTILDRQLAELEPVAREILIVGGEGPVPATAAVDRVRAVPDRVPGCGPLAGLHTALAETRGAATIVLACDMPFVTAALAEYLLALTGDADAVVPRTERGYHPLCAAYTRACLEPIARRLADGRLKVIDVLEDVRVRVVTGEELDAFGNPHRLLANVNTPAEYLGLEALQGHKL